MIRGYCIGGGLLTALQADIRICSDDSQFGVPAARLGLGYGFGGVDQLMQLVGPSWASEILFSARRLDRRRGAARRPRQPRRARRDAEGRGVVACRCDPRQRPAHGQVPQGRHPRSAARPVEARSRARVVASSRRASAPTTTGKARPRSWRSGRRRSAGAEGNRRSVGQLQARPGPLRRQESPARRDSDVRGSQVVASEADVRREEVAGVHMLDHLAGG